MPVELFNQGGHQCLMFTDLSGPGAEAVQSNQFLIVDDDNGAVLDPGGNLAYNELFLGLSRHFSPQRLQTILASHADPDIIASLDRWMTSTPAKLYISTLWARFAPHFCKPGRPRAASSASRIRACASAWGATTSGLCRRTFCTRRATSSSGTR